MMEPVFSASEVESLNAFQDIGFMHGFTCGHDSGHGLLIATTDGWICRSCPYTQDWAHNFMMDWEWKRCFDFQRRILDHKPKPEDVK